MPRPRDTAFPGTAPSPSPPPPSPDEGEPSDAPPLRPPPAAGFSRFAWLGLGMAATGLGFAGIALPGLPATVFFIAAAACFARSSPSLLAWILDLPKVGPLVRDYRDGRGMPRGAKVAASTLMACAGTISVLTLSAVWTRALVLALLAIGAAVVWFAIPTARPRPAPTPGGSSLG